MGLVIMDLLNNPYSCYCGFEPNEGLTKTNPEEWHAVYTIQLGELISSGVFDWESEILNWREYAYDERQHSRFCLYFMERFKFREIGILPFLEWANRLHSMLCYELMPKYKDMYRAIENGINPLADKDEFGKDRRIKSAYPETLLSGNSDFATDGDDFEFEHFTIQDIANTQENYIAKFVSVDEAMANELEVLFISMYTTGVNGY